MKNTFGIFLTLAFILTLNINLTAGHGGKAPEIPDLAVQLGAPFRDNAILQRQMKVPVWGWSNPGTKVKVSFAGQTKEATAGQDGKWMLELDPLKASFEPREMTVTDDSGKSVTLKNILVGEVWLASGQSNMQWTVTKSTSNKLKVEPVGEKKINPIREFEVKSVYAMLHPIKKAKGYWKDGDYTNYSAIAFAFAHKLYEELKVPIGILNCSFSQTAIQAWIPREGFASGEDEYTKKINQKCLETDPTTPEHKKAWDAFYKSLEDQIKANEERVKNDEDALPVSAKVPGNMHGNRDANWLFNGRLSPVVPYAIRGAIWNQGYANSGEGLPYYNNLHSLINGWRIVWDKPELPVYFHQFYSKGKRHVGKGENKPTIDGCAEMRLGTYLARDIPNAGMASQIDIYGAIHYQAKAVPGQRLALHALKNQYGQKDLVVEGPMFKSYKVEGDKIVIEFENTEGGLVVAETASNYTGKNIKGEKIEGATGFANPKIIENGEDQVKLFFVADENRVWHPATCKIDGEKVIVSSPEVKNPRGVSYATGEVGWEPNLYNKSLLPMTPFIYYDNKMVTSKDWPDEKLKIAGETIDPDSIGKTYEYRKMPLLSTQFRDDAVLQADVPVTIWGSVRNYGEYQDKPEEGDCKVIFEFGDIKKTIQVTPDMWEWKVTIPPMKATTKPATLKVKFTIDGEMVHERVIKGIIFGDVVFVAAPPVEFKVPEVKPSGQIVRMIENQSKRSDKNSPSRFSVCVSRTPGNRFAAYWKKAEGLAAAIGNSIAAKTKRPVGVIFMERKKKRLGKGKKSIDDSQLKYWIAPAYLKMAPTLMEDYKTVGSLYPDNPYYNDNIRNYISAWKEYWNEYIPEMMETKAVPDGIPWGKYPSVTGSAGKSTATQSYNVLVHSFTPAALKAVIFISSDAIVKEDNGKNFGPEMTALGTSFIKRFKGNPLFIYTIPSKALAPEITKPEGIKGKSEAVEISDWKDVSKLIETIVNQI